MPWLIKTRGRLLHARDGSGPDRPVYIIDDQRLYPFEHLPPGTDPLNDGDLVCCPADSLKGHEPAPILEAVQPAPPPAPKPESDEKPKKRKARVR